MMGAPWLDIPSKITESELSTLESNYESMLETIRHDTFGGVAPPKYDAKQYHSFLKTNQNEAYMQSFDVYDQKNQSRAATNQSIHVFHEHQEEAARPDSGLAISFHPSTIQRRNIRNNRNNNGNLNESSMSTNDNLLLDLEFNANSDRNTSADDVNQEYQATQQAFDQHEINLSAQRVRLQLNMTNSPSLSPIPHSNDSSMINVNLSDISRSMHEYKTDDTHVREADEHKFDVSLPFMSPSMADALQRPPQQTQAQQRQQARIFVPSSISPPIFSTSHIGHSQSEQPLLHNAHMHSGFFSSAPPTNPRNTNTNDNSHLSHDSHNTLSLQSQSQSQPQPILIPPPPQIPMAFPQSNRSHSQILQRFGIPDSVTSSMMFTPSNSIPTMPQIPAQNTSASFIPPLPSSNSNRAASQSNTSSASFDINQYSFHSASRNQQSMQPPAAPPRRRNRLNRRNATNDLSFGNSSSHNQSSEALNDSRSHSAFAQFVNHEINNVSLASIQHDLGSDPMERSETPTNSQQRSHAISLEAPRPQRRYQNRRRDTSSVDLTNQHNINL
eukprot:CAMPEP_0197078450 /NCGR_PEP_ID=MMETSP1384-20130603/213128_1 /TAXON_ID=29189 /ORGANISM="Ammonia sp." /LENGTH=555 /DNA_ID=CAMNT_0042517317 /DNA_START=62 /DNA_END=1729 /DNA_ORIENTATION=-